MFKSPLFIFSILILVLQCNSLFLHRLLKTERCWYVSEDRSYLSHIIVKNCYEIAYTRSSDNILVFSTESSSSIQETNTNCDGFIIIQSNLSDPEFRHKITVINSSVIIDTKILLITEHSEQNYDDMKKMFKTTYLSVIIIKISKADQQNNGFELDVYNLSHYKVEAPLINLELLYDEDKHNDFGTLDDIFKIQKWNPSEKNTIFRILSNMYPPFTTINEKGELSGVEYLVAKVASDKWKTTLTSIADSGIKVIIN